MLGQELNYTALGAMEERDALVTLGETTVVKQMCDAETHEVYFFMCFVEFFCWIIAVSF